MDKKHILEKVKEWQDCYLIDSYALEALTYDQADADSRWMSKFATAEDNKELFDMVKEVFPPRD